MKKLLFACSFLTVLSCSKEEHGEDLLTEDLKGIVLHAVSGQPLPGQTVLLSVHTQRISTERSLEFPNGAPYVETKTYSSASNDSGRFFFSVQLAKNSVFTLDMSRTGTYRYTSNWGAPLGQEDMKAIRDVQRTLFDTLLVERVGYIRFNIRHTGGYENEALYVSTPYTNSIIRPDKYSNGYNRFNWLFFGPTNFTRMDTVPAETRPVLPVEWLHRHTDTLQYKKDSIAVQPGVVKDYNLFY